MQPKGQLPQGIEAILAAGLEVSDEDKIVALKDELAITQAALEQEKSLSKELDAEVKLLRDNAEIKKDAVWYSKLFLILIPVFCLILLVASGVKTFDLSVGDAEYSIAWNLEIESYAQAAFVVGPILFVATVLGFLLKGVFGQSSKEDEISLAALRRSLTDQK